MRDSGDDHAGGFSLVELIVAIMILGVLAAIAVPIFLSVRAEAESNALKAAAARGALTVVATIADGGEVSRGDLSHLETGDITRVLPVEGFNSSVHDICVRAEGFGTFAVEGTAAECNAVGNPK